MAAEKRDFRLQQDKSCLFLTSSDPLPEFRQLEVWLEKQHSHLLPVRREFWQWQVDQRSFLNRLLVACDQKGHPVDFPAFPWLRFSEEIRVLEDYLQPWKDVFSGGEMLYPPAPATAFCREGDILCQVHLEHSRTLLSVDAERVQMNQQGDVLEYRSLSSGYLYFLHGKLSLMDVEEKDSENINLFLRMGPVVEDQRVVLRDALSQLVRKGRALYPEAAFMLQDGSELIPYLDDDRPRKILLAQGKPRMPARDASLEILKKPEQKPGEKQDFKEIRQYCEVKSGDEIALKHLINPGQDGMDLEGHALEAGSARDIHVKIQGPIRQEVRDDTLVYIADEGGLFISGENTLEVKEVFRIEGNVDFHTGNVEYDKMVEITGDVKSGFHVISKSDIIVHGCVENGVILESGGDSMVLGGVLGEDTRIKAHGKVQVSFLQDAQLYALDDITVEKNVLRGSIYSGGKLRVLGKGVGTSHHGAILGGEYSALLGMRLFSLGSDAAETSLTLGHNLEMSREIAEIQKTQASFEREQITLMQELPLDLNDPVSRRKLQSLDEHSRKEMSRILIQMKNLSAEREKLHAEEVLRQEKEYTPEDQMPVIQVEKGLFGVNHIQLGKHKRNYHFADMEEREIYLFRKEILLRGISE